MSYQQNSKAQWRRFFKLDPHVSFKLKVCTPTLKYQLIITSFDMTFKTQGTYYQKKKTRTVNYEISARCSPMVKFIILPLGHSPEREREDILFIY